jgi:hypothetical protein
VSGYDVYGLEVWPGYLTANESSRLRREGEELYIIRPPCVKVRDRHPGAFTAHTVPARLQRAMTSLPEFDRLLATPLVQKTADRYLGPGWGIVTYIYERAVPADGVLYPTHQDDFDGYACMKVYVYLSDADKETGALRIEGKTITGPEGTIVFFDPRRTHGGSEITKGVRSIARAHLVEWRYVLKHLPEQLPWRWRLVSQLWRAWRWIRRETQRRVWRDPEPDWYLRYPPTGDRGVR